MNENDKLEKFENEILSSFEDTSADFADIVSEDIARAIEEKTGRTEEDDEKKREYRVGGYVFKTYYEYRNAEDDIKRIEIIKKNIDISDPEAAVRLYNMIREGEIEFKSPI
jgi:sortase B